MSCPCLLLRPRCRSKVELVLGRSLCRGRSSKDLIYASSRYSQCLGDPSSSHAALCKFGRRNGQRILLGLIVIKLITGAGGLCILFRLCLMGLAKRLHVASCFPIEPSASDGSQRLQPL